MSATAPHAAGGTRLAVIGGGLAGMAAATAAGEHGLTVELFEARPRLGGRAAAALRLPDGQSLDRCPHVAMGCCTNFRDFCRQAGIADCLGAPQRRYRFIAADGRCRTFADTPLLPPPLHLLPGVLRLNYLTCRERWAIVRSMPRLARQGDGDATVGDWLRQQRQSPQALRRFWTPIVESALGETLERDSCAAAAKVFRDGFLAARQAYRLIRPSDLAAALDRAGDGLAQRGVQVCRGMRVRQVDGGPDRAPSVLLADGRRREFDFLVVAVPWWQVGRLLSPALSASLPHLAQLGQLAPAPIVAVHLWYREPLAAPEHAALLERTSQWFFVHGDYAQVVISAAHGLVDKPPAEIVDTVCRELAAIWPSAGHVQLRDYRVVASRRAVFSVRPGSDAIRPPQQTALPNVMLAGDWTQTGWPATMEGAVRSGRLAAAAILSRLGREPCYLTPDLPRGWPARLLLGRDRG